MPLEINLCVITYGHLDQKSFTSLLFIYTCMFSQGRLDKHENKMMKEHVITSACQLDKSLNI